MKDLEQLPRTHEELITLIADGFHPKFVFFWGNKAPSDGAVTKSCFSQWYAASFDVDGVNYQTAEHFMMAEKARLFGDVEKEREILEASNPGHAKKLGREVRGYEDDVWNENRFQIVVRGNVAKFEQNEEMGEFLRNTNQRVLVEASPVDRIWGIGMAVDDTDIENPDRWRGPNLLGFALMEAREQISN